MPSRERDAMNIPAEHDERKTDHGIRFYGVVTLGNLIAFVPLLAMVLVWGLRLEGRVDHESDLRARIELRITTMDSEAKMTMAKLDDRLGKISDGIVDLKLAVVDLRKSTGPQSGMAKP